MRCKLTWRQTLNGAVVVLLVAVALITWRLWPKPPLSAYFPHSTAVYAANGQLLRLTLASDGQYRLWTPYREFPPQFVQAVLLHEDQWFWWHPGFNPWGLVRGAWETYVEHHHPQGGSTITMQLVRLMDGLHTRTPWGKFKQVLLAVQLELGYSKKAILTAYLNYAPYGGNVVGAGTASLIYFDTPASALTLPEALTLAVLPQNPSQDIATRISGHTVLARELARSRDALYRDWLAHHPAAVRWQPLFRMPLAVRLPSQLPFRAPHAVDQVLANLERQGQPLPSRITTTIDPELQALVTNQLQHYVKQHAGIGIHNAAAVLVDTQTMGIRALVGSADFFNRRIDGQVNGTLAERSPGSTLKPFIYALGFEEGVITPATMLRDVPTNFGAYSPENFDSAFDGPVSAAQALIRSRNVPAVWVDNQLGQHDLYHLLQQVGIRDLASRQHYGLSLVLGGGDITAQELASLYAMLDNHGLFRPLRLRHDAPKAQGIRVLSPAATFMVTDVLEQNPPPDSAVSARHGAPVFWKTGTSWAFHDAWTAGGFGPYVLVVWVGNFNSTPNPAFVGLEAAAPLFFRIYDALQITQPALRDAPRPVPPENAKRVQICLPTGLLPSHWCPQRGSTWFIPGVSPISVGHIYRPVVVANVTGLPACPPYDPKLTHTEVFQYWPSDLATAFRRMGIPLKPPPRAPQCQTTGGAEGEKPQIDAPARGRTYIMNGNQPDDTLTLTASADANVADLYWFIGKDYIGKTHPGQALYWRPQHSGHYLLKLVDDHDRSTQQWLDIEWQ